MKIPIYQIDAFSGWLFSGNPAAVCPLETWLNDELMLSIARENNLSETAFFVPEGSDFSIRWFTPVSEVDLCGHATLAAAYVIFTELEPARAHVTFSSPSGPLHVQREKGMLALDFPAQKPDPCVPPDTLLQALNRTPTQVLCAEDYFLVFGDEDEILELRPDMTLLSQVDLRGVIVTAPGKCVDFVSRFFVPRLGIPEDPVTGSAHCALIPYWSETLGKTELHALQLSERGGELFCRHAGERVIIAGHAVKYMEGTLHIRA
ncbi:MAG: PhzF family phenazine biosynthesis protein [Desulfomonilia bacterium]|nr:PhzF family phenazine biosynthesis protein [Desulfomonilia bacterium]